MDTLVFTSNVVTMTFFAIKAYKCHGYTHGYNNHHSLISSKTLFTLIK